MAILEIGKSLSKSRVRDLLEFFIDVSVKDVFRGYFD